MSEPETISGEKIRPHPGLAGAKGEGLTPADGDKKSILRARANALAQEENRKVPGTQVEVVEFLLACERYCIESAFVREVYPLRALTPLPGTPPFVSGIINLRGEIISVLDIRKFFELPEKGITDLNKVIVLQDAAMEFGILADAVSGTRSVSLENLQPAPSTFTGVRAQFLRGITGEGVAFLDATRLLSDPNLVINQEAETSTKRTV